MKIFGNNVRRYIGMFMICLIISSTFFIFNSNVFAEVSFEYKTSADFDIKGTGGMKTTYSNNGYTTVLKVGGTQGNVVNGTGTVAGVTCTTTGTSISNGNYVKVNYHLVNTNSSAVTISLASHADIQIDATDSAPITALEGGRGFTMTDGTSMLTFIGKDSYGVTNIDTYWFGKYSDRTSNMWNQINSTGITGIDSGMAYSWQNRTIPANSSIDLSILFGVGELNEPPTLTATNTLKDKYFVNEDVQLIGKVNDIDNGDVVTIKYAVDGGTEYTVPGTYTPNGTAIDYSATFTIPSDITEGNHTIQIWAADNKGNMSIPVTKTFYVELDKEAPTGQFTIDPTDWTSGDVEISVKATDSYSGVKQIILPDNTVVSADTASFTATQNGDYLFILQDNANNKRNYTITISNIDKDIPNGTATITQPTATVRNAIINFTASDIGSGVSKIVKPDGTEVTSITTTYNVATSGVYTFKIIDNVGNENTVDVNVEIASDGIEVKYIDNVTNLEISTKDTLSGNVGDTYTTTPKEIEGYELVKTPTNANGSLTLDKQTVTYEYRKNSNVIVKYIDENSGNKIIEDVITKYKEGDTYTTEEKTFEGYGLSNKTENTSGTVGRENIIVQYNYKKISAGVDVKYIDQVTKLEISEMTHKDGLENDTYTIIPKEIEGYELVKTPTNANGSLTLDKQTVTFEYRKNSNVIVKYTDENSGNKIIEDVVKKYKEGDTYTTEEKEFEGYVLIDKTENTSGTVERENITVEYKYKKISEGVDIVYIDQVTKEEIEDTIHIDGLENTPYTSTSKEIEGYELVKTPQNASGSMAVDIITVIYEYRKNSHVTTKYLNENNGYVLSSQVDEKYKEGDPYTTEQLDIEGYTFTRVDGEPTGTVGREDITVTYYYKKNTSVTVKYVDMLDNNKEIAESIVIPGLQNDNYETTKKVIDGYTFVAVEGIANGKMGYDPTEVIYKYKKVSNLITEHIDANTNEKIVPDVLKKYKEGDTYQAYAQNIEGYVLEQEPDEKTGTMGREDIVKTFYYKRVSAGLVVRYVDRITNELLDKVVYEGTENDEITLEEKSFLGYVLNQRPENDTVILGVNLKEVTFYYRKAVEMNVIGVDQQTGEELYRTTISGVEGDPYTTTARHVDGYELVKTPDNEMGTYDRNDTDVVYEYIKIAERVVVRYIDEETGEDLDSYIIEGTAGKNYKTEKKTFENYKLVEILGNEVGTLSDVSQEVIYYYRRNTGKVRIRYVTEKNTELLKEEIIGKAGEEYDITIKDVPGYELVNVNGETTGTYTEGTKVITVTLRKIEIPVQTGKVVVKYIDQDNKEVLREEELGIVGEDYSVIIQDVPGYERISVEGESEGQYKVETQEIIVRLEKIKEHGKVIVKYIDQDGIEISTEEMIGDVDTDYKVTIKEFSGYKLVEVTGETEGQYSIETKEVIIRLEKEEKPIQMSKVILKYVDKNNKEIHKDEYIGFVGGNYVIIVREIYGYKIVEVIGETEGEFELEEKEIIVKVEKEGEEPVENGKVIVKYIDQDGKEVIKEELTGNVGEDYKVTVKEISGYKVVEVTGEIEGQYEIEEKEVIVRIEKEETPIENGKVTIKYIDQNGKEILKDEIAGNVGTDYKVTIKNIPGYKVVDVTGETEGQYSAEEKEVIVTLKKEEKPTQMGNVILKYIDENNNEVHKEEYIGIVGKNYTITVKEIAGYKIVEVIGETSGQYEIENKEIIVKVEKEEILVETGKVTVKYVDQDGKEISKDEMIGNVGTDYKVKIKYISGYKVVEIIGNTEGQYEIEDKEVIVKLEKEEEPVETGKVTVIYVDQDEKEISKDEMIGNVGTDYKVTIKNIPGYKVVDVVGNIEGKYENEKREVIIKLEKEEVPVEKEGTIVIKYVDKEGNTIKEDYIEKGKVGEKFYKQNPEIDGYELVGDKTISTTFKDGEVVYKVEYKKISEEKPDEPKEPEEVKPIEDEPQNIFDLPNTGDINIVLYIGICIFSIIGLIKALKIKSNI